MAERPLIDVRPDLWEIVCDILRQHVSRYEVWAFGSRARWTAKPYSDLDLAVITHKPLTLDESAALADAFSESDLPWRVDVVDWATTSESFRKIIERDKVVVQRASGEDVDNAEALGVELRGANATNGIVGRVSDSVTRQGAGYDEAVDVGLRLSPNPTYSAEVPEYSLKSLCLLVTDCPHATPKWTNSGVIVLRNQNIKGGRLDLSSPSFTDEAHYLGRIRRAAPQAGDIVITREAPMGDVCLIPQNLKCCLGQRQVLLRPDPKKVNSRFLLYALQSPYIQHQIGWNEGTGSTVSNLRIPVLEDLKVATPPLEDQRQIAETLGSIDDRITLLRETNATLEAIAQALFKSWFVDFDPVHAKQQGRPPDGMDEATAALFPDSFEESAVGLVPRGWSAAAITDVVEGIYDGPHATPPESSEGPVFLGIKNLTGSALELSEIRHIAEDDFGNWTRRVTPQGGDIVFTYEATLGFFALIPEGLRCCLGRRLALIRPRPINGFGHFWFHQFVAPPFQRLLQKHTIHGATVNRIALKEFPSYSVLNPTDAIKAAFDAVVAPLWRQIQNNQKQAQTLANLRDTLLPRLISGQLRLPEAKIELAMEETMV